VAHAKREANDHNELDMRCLAFYDVKLWKDEAGRFVVLAVLRALKSIRNRPFARPDQWRDLRSALLRRP
jgi:hypothetical protein